MGLLEVLTVIFVVLKLTHVIDWSWWAVFIPEYISLGIVGLVLLIGGSVVGIVNRRG